MAEEHEIEKSFGANEKVGDYLRRIREAREIELRQMAKTIRLSEEVLQAIEDNRWGYFKIEAYLRSYVVSICEKLSLDKNEVLRRLSSEKNSLSDMVSMAEKPKAESSSSNGSGSNGNQIAKIAVAVVIVLALILAAQALNSRTDTMRKAAETDIEEPEIAPEEEAAEQDSLAMADSIAAAAAEPEAKIDVDAIDTLRFECTPAATDSTCGVVLAGLDTKVKYFRRWENRYVPRADSAQITITVPWRTRMLINGTKLDYGKFNTVIFYNGEIVKKYNRDLR